MHEIIVILLIATFAILAIFVYKECSENDELYMQQRYHAKPKPKAKKKALKNKNKKKR